MLILTSQFSFAQNTRLTFRPTRAEWSAVLQRIVMVSSGPNQLHLFDPVARTAQSIALGAAPVSLSISPNGLFAAVGHAGSASYVDLSNRTVVRTYTYPAAQGQSSQSSEVVLASEWLYVLPSYVSDPVSIRLSNGEATSLSFTYSSGGRLHPEGKAIYTTRDGIGPNDVQRFSITATGALSYYTDSPYHGDYSFCGGIWFSPDASRIYNGCGTVVRYNADPAQDMKYFGRFFGAQVRAFSESVTGRIAAIPSQSSTPTSGSGTVANADNKVVLIASNGFQEQGRLAIPEFPVGARNYLGQGRWVFFSNNGAALHVVYQAEAASGLLNDFAVQTYELANPAACTASFAAPTLTVGSEGKLQIAEIHAAADCLYNAISTVDWVQVLSGGFGTGNAQITVHVRANTGAAARTGSVNLGAQSLQISQAGSVSTVPSQQIFSYKIVDAEYSKALDRVVLVTDPMHELHLYDPLTRLDQFVPLSYPALAVSVAPDGMKAAVGHTGYVSIVNLQTRAVEKVIPIGIEAKEVMLTGDTWVYAFSDRESQVIEIATNAARTVNTVATFARLHASRNFAYLGSSYSGWSRLDVRNGGNVTSGYASGPSTCNNAWVSEDGRRVYTACGNVYRSSDSPTEDGVPNGSLSGLGQYSTGTGWIVHSSARQQIAVVTGSSSYSSSSPADVQLYADDGLPLLGRIRLAGRVEGATTLMVRGRWLFWNQASSRLYAIAQIDPNQSSGTGATVPLSDYSLEVVLPETLAACAVTVTPQTLAAPGGGGLSNLTVQTGAACVWSATVEGSNYWVRFQSGYSSSYVGTGPGTLTLSIDRNTGTASRTATVVVGGSAVTVTQGLPNPLTVTPLTATVTAAGTTASIFVTATGTGLPWSAISNVNWITMLNGANFVGSATVQYRVAANTSTAPRSGTMTIAGETVRVDQAGGSLTGGMRFVPVAPCRVVDTRGSTGETGAFGQPVMEGGSQREFPIPQGRCNIPSTATAYSLNATVVPRGPLSYLSLWPAGQPRPLVSTLNSFDGRIKANAAIVPAGTGGAISAYVTDRTELIVDINGYFIPAASNSYPFFSVTPCRVVDTRNATATNGGPSLTAGQTRNFVISGACSGAVPMNAIAYSLNVTVVPRSGPLSYVTIWPTGAAQPIVSTLNAPTGTVVANAAIVPSGTGGSINVFATDAADVVIDINGFFASTGQTTALSFFPVTPCRVSDSRNAAGEFGGPVLAAGGTRSYTVPGSACGIATAARAYSLNATVVPVGTLSYLTVWPTGQTQPLVSTLNSFDGSVVANALLVPAGSNGAINTYVTDQTQLILDINGFFAP